MSITTNFPLSEKSVEEFVRILLPTEVGKDIKGEAIYKENKIILKVEIDGKEASMEEENLESIIEDQKVIMLKGTLLKAFDKHYPWGSLIGVRPTKMTRRFLQMGFSRERVVKLLSNMYLASLEKIELLMRVIETEEKLLNKEAMNMYIGIPFCPSKCRYCSFASYEINSSLGRFYPKFVETLLEEIELVGELSKERGFIYESLYIGGGTPSVLTEEDTEKVLAAVHKHIDFSNLKEFTFEAGREDAITREKLEILKKYGVDRVSLNPQTFKEETLKSLNRTFNRKHFDEVYRDIKEIGFILNMDLILGLPGESVEDILNTLEELKKYEIDNLTIHSLAKKKGSPLYHVDFEQSEVERVIVEGAIKKLVKEKGMQPYYMYRQKNSLDWGENVGYSTLGNESRFNIEMIEENQQTMGLGGGAISKAIHKETEYIDQIERLVNPKDPALYIAEMKLRHDKKIKLFSKEIV
ncbi:coproporphyrinogen III oxidase [Candidatus Cetobacterium colombiensis]|uniref:Coproporphyrinogen III oxidase n=1 Tax=Candidatus Cetobacterium colombiensis TaxID=3073100 RepID=A0ABU4WBT6_9FUSO|nr:coproporphyrinogen III oxidase [Candidatus Cetobacterium colombiensis]MDX8335830.1 coproporphyrinogen III oxidase [Candidatus Cetobacterium colombiensis]